MKDVGRYNKYHRRSSVMAYVFIAPAMMVKKMIAVVLTATMLFSVTACGSPGTAAQPIRSALRRLSRSSCSKIEL